MCVCHDVSSETTSFARSYDGNISIDNNRTKRSGWRKGTRCRCIYVEQRQSCKLECWYSGALTAVANCVVNCQEFRHWTKTVRQIRFKTFIRCFSISRSQFPFSYLDGKSLPISCRIMKLLMEKFAYVGWYYWLKVAKNLALFEHH